MDKVNIVYWPDGKFWIGYLQNYPDYLTQGETIEELRGNLKEIYNEIKSGQIPSIRTVEELVIE
jgi:predicted RNase H-like HicB family nuclease